MLGGRDSSCVLSGRGREQFILEAQARTIISALGRRQPSAIAFFPPCPCSVPSPAHESSSPLMLVTSSFATASKHCLLIKHVPGSSLKPNSSQAMVYHACSQQLPGRITSRPCCALLRHWCMILVAILLDSAANEADWLSMMSWQGISCTSVTTANEESTAVESLRTRRNTCQSIMHAQSRQKCMMATLSDYNSIPKCCNISCSGDTSCLSTWPLYPNGE